MSLSVPYLVLLAKQSEIEELKRLRTRSTLVELIGRLIHDLQAERGASSIFLASAGARFEAARLALIAESEAAERGLRMILETEVGYPALSNAKVLALMAWILVGLDALPELRERIRTQRLSGNDSVTAFSRLIAGMIALIFVLADSAADPTISRLLVGLFNLVEGKEYAGQERAVGALLFGAGSCASPLQQRVAYLIDAQQGNFRLFQEFSDEAVRRQWAGLEDAPVTARLQQLRQILTGAKPGEALDANLADNWFDCCTERLSALWSMQCALVNALKQRCAERITEAEAELFDSEGLLRELRDNPPARAGVIDRFFDPALPLEPALSLRSGMANGSGEAGSVIGLLQGQSLRLATMEEELESAKRALNERRVVERAKGVLMARFNLSEPEAHKQMRKISMERNLRLQEVAESVLTLATNTQSPARTSSP